MPYRVWRQPYYSRVPGVVNHTYDYAEWNKGDCIIKKDCCLPRIGTCGRCGEFACKEHFVKATGRCTRCQSALEARKREIEGERRSA